MEIKNLKVRMASLGLSLALAGLGSSLLALGYVANLRRKENKVKVK